MTAGPLGHDGAPRRPRRRCRAIAVLVAAVAVLTVVRPGLASAQRYVAPEEVSAIARDLSCPLCQGYSLQDCPLPVCAQMRELIRERLAAGDSREEITDMFVAQYGPQVLSAPPRRGAFLAAWLVPLAALMAAALLAVRRLRTEVGGGPPAQADSLGGAVEAVGEDVADPAYVERIERLIQGEDEV